MCLVITVIETNDAPGVDMVHRLFGETGERVSSGLCPVWERDSKRAQTDGENPLSVVWDRRRDGLWLKNELFSLTPGFG